jgi:hypothetical protein
MSTISLLAQQELLNDPMFEPMIYQFSTCSAILFEEENVYLDTSPAIIRSHYRTIPQRTTPHNTSQSLHFR